MFLYQLFFATIILAAKASPVQPKSVKAVNISNGSGKSKSIAQSLNNKENAKLNQNKSSIYLSK